MEQNKRRPERLDWRFVISLFLHLVVGFSLAAFGSAFTPALPLEEKPVELTIVDLSATPPPLVPKNPPFMETDPSKESAEKPKEQTFESNANSIAASKLPATGDRRCRRRRERIVPFVNLETHAVFASDRRIETAARSAIDRPAGIQASHRGNDHRRNQSPPQHPRLAPARRHNTGARTARDVELNAAATDQGPGRNRSLLLPRWPRSQRHRRRRGQNRNWPLPVIRRKRRKRALPAG